ncbi:MAG: alginate export family protein, partial [Sedimentisphaerales bacterium]|nr:alginate export family protein [Sedimentisphaerales bacterium]
MWKLTKVLMLLNAVSRAAPGAEAENRPVEPQPPHWSDALKDIPIGRFQLDIGGSIRFRSEYQKNFNAQRYADTRKQTYREDGFLLQRTRLDFDLHFAEEARLYTEIQDARAYDSDFSKDDFFANSPYWNDADMRQVYLEWLHIGDSPFGFRIGRQTIFYGDNRIWGPGNWGNVGRYTWDAAKVITDLPFAETHFIFANRVRYEPHHFDQRDR